MTNYTFAKTQEFSKELVNDLSFIDTIYAVNNGADYSCNTFDTWEEAQEEADLIVLKMGGECRVVEVKVYENYENETLFFHIN